MKFNYVKLQNQLMDVKKAEKERKHKLIEEMKRYRNHFEEFQKNYKELKEKNKILQKENQRLKQDYLAIPSVIRKIFKNKGKV